MRATIGLLAAALLAAPDVGAQTPAKPRESSKPSAPARMPGLTHRFTVHHVTSADGTRIGYLVAGVGRPLVMVHGSMTIADEWLAVADRLARTRRVVVIERRGRERSGEATAHSLAIEAQDLAAVVADVVGKQNATDSGRGQVDLFGHSYGGAVVARFAIDVRFPGAVVLYDPGAGLNGPIAAGQRGPVRDLIAADKREEALTRAFETIMSASPAVIAGIRRNVPLWERYVTLLPSWIREVESLDTFAPTSEELGRIRGRTTILLGDRSGPMLTGIAGTWVSRQPGITVLPLRGQGHAGNLEAPAYVAERIQAALRE